MFKKMIFSCALLLACTTPALAETLTPTLLEANALHWQPVPVAPELHYAVLAGNPDKHEFFVVRLKLPKDYTDVIHQHAYDRYDTVISGAFYLGFGDTVDKSKTRKLSAGGFVTCPAKAKHFGYTEEETVIQISGIGPWEALKTAGANR